MLSEKNIQNGLSDENILNGVEKNFELSIKNIPNGVEVFMKRLSFHIDILRGRVSIDQLRPSLTN